jgi:hypothetical protein
MNLTGEDCRLNPLSVYTEFPRERVFVARWVLNFQPFEPTPRSLSMKCLVSAGLWSMVARFGYEFAQVLLF